MRIVQAHRGPALRLVTILLFVAGLCLVLSAQSNTTGLLRDRLQISRGDMTTPSTNTYDPAQYGLPATIGGYRVLAVLTPDNTACLEPDERHLVVQASQEDVEGVLAQEQSADVWKDLERLGLTKTARWFVRYAGLGTTLQDLIVENEKWNSLAQSGGCLRNYPTNHSGR